MTAETVFVGLSGGVDSSVAAKRLLECGYNVVGVFIKTWQPDFISCNWEAERLDAMRVCAHLGIPFLTCDAEASYRDAVAQYMIGEYKKGRTPNPDVMCNKFVKFGTFLEFAKAKGAHKIATGHYAQVRMTGDRYGLLRGVDEAKDQSYFLWTLTQHELAHTLFPVGGSTKEDIRTEAAQAGLHTSAKPDSQGVCFLGEIDVKNFLSHYLKAEPGSVLNENGIPVGVHDGALLYTIGERHGFKVLTTGASATPHYVVSKDIEKNTITVRTKPLSLVKGTVVLTGLNAILDDIPEACEAQFRYRQQPFEVNVKHDGTHATLTLRKEVDMPSPGQSCAFYDGAVCLGGGIIDSIR